MIKDLTWVHTKGLKKNNLYFILIILLLPTNLTSQNQHEIGVMFYNVENLFDIKNDSIKLDDEYTPDGDRNWNYFRYAQKLKNISRVIYESGKWNPPALIGLCEIENKEVLQDLIWQTGLKNLGYDIIHYQSPDQRGIDVALLYKEDEFTVLESIPIKVEFGTNTRPTRDILYVFGYLKDTIPLNIFVAHFPSRYGGVQDTKPLRFKAAEILSDTVKHIMVQNPDANIIAMGDFNDEPNDESMQYLVANSKLINMASKLQTINNSAGTLKHQFEWNTFDHFLVSKNLLDKKQSIYINDSMKVMDFNFLLEDDKIYTGLKPYRTYIGYKYNNGFSDHFPIWLTLKVQP